MMSVSKIPVFVFLPLALLFAAPAALAQIEDPLAMNHGPNGQIGYSGDSDTGSRESSKEQYNQGLAALGRGQFREAERDFTHALTSDPSNAAILTSRGRAREGQGDFGGALHDYQKSLKIDPTQIDALRGTAIAQAKLGHADKARGSLGLLKLQSQGCAATCADAAVLKDAIVAVEAALPGTPNAGS
jgi:tetratricopeptide (TPR) repeat protein